jgi:hypothetical protein
MRLSLAKFITVIIAVMMMAQGVAMIWHPESAGPAALSALSDDFGGSAPTAGAFLIVSFFFTIVAAVRPPLVWLVVVQLGVSVVYAIGGLAAIARGSYADGYVPAGGSFFIFNDQVMAITLLSIHAVAAVKQFAE